MAAASYPKWLSDCKLQLTNSAEWQALTSELQAAIEQQLTESHVDQFANLSNAERKLFLERAFTALKNGELHSKFNSKLANSINKHISTTVAQQLLEGSGFPPSATKSDLILDHANEASVMLLQRWPEMKSKLHRCFNRPLSTGLQQMAWRLFLANPTVKSKYLSRLERDPESTMSLMDLEIIQKSEALLQSEPTFRSLAYKPDVLHAMKAILSYHHARKQTKTSLLDTDYMLSVPFLVNAMATHDDHFVSRGSNDTHHLVDQHLTTRESLASLVEQYSTLMATRPAYMKESYNQDFKEAMRICSAKISGTLEVLDQQVAHHLANILRTDAKQLPLTESLKQLTRPMVRSLFVGYLSFDALLYVWDQHILGLDAPEYDVIPAIAVLILMYLRGHLLECQTGQEAAEKLKKESHKLKKEQLMHGIHKHFHKELYSLLVKDGGIPVLDPTQMPMPWEEWHNESLPPVVRPQDRHLSRQEREDRRQKEIELQRQREEERLKEELARRKKDGDEWQKQRRKDERAHAAREEELLKLLEEEQRKRLVAERQAREEINRLRDELNKLKQDQQNKSDSPQPIIPPQIGLDLLKGVMTAVNKLAQKADSEGNPPSQTPSRDSNIPGPSKPKKGIGP